MTTPVSNSPAPTSVEEATKLDGEDPTKETPKSDGNAKKKESEGPKKAEKEEKDADAKEKAEATRIIRYDEVLVPNVSTKFKHHTNGYQIRLQIIHLETRQIRQAEEEE
jgi:hypothetical protein